MSSTKPYLRMKAVLMMYKVFLRYPDALKPAFPKLKEKLEDPDPGKAGFLSFSLFNCKSNDLFVSIIQQKKQKVFSLLPLM